MSEAPVPAGALSIGSVVGNYRIEAKIGEGGMGAVYLATHPLIGRKAAVKVLLPEHSRRADLVDRFFNEAKTAASLRHPALVEVFDFGFLPDGAGYLVMDYLDGESLAARLQRVAPLSPEIAADIGRQIALGVAAAHGHGIVHRDLKPDNIFLVPDPEDPARERVKILDFGIAKLVLPAGPGSKGATATGMLLGTPLFMAPEQCRGAGHVDHRADIYSVGCILYMMLAGKPPFDYEGVGEILAAHLHQPVPPLRTINPAVPDPIAGIAMHALAKDPAERYQTMVELASDLQAFLRNVRGGGTLALPSGSSSLRMTPPAVAASPAPVSSPVSTAPGPARTAPLPPSSTTLGAAATSAVVPAIVPSAGDSPPSRTGARVALALAGLGVLVVGVGGVLVVRALVSHSEDGPRVPPIATVSSPPPSSAAPAPAPAPTSLPVRHPPPAAPAPAAREPAAPAPAAPAAPEPPSEPSSAPAAHEEAPPSVLPSTSHARTSLVAKSGATEEAPESRRPGSASGSRHSEGGTPRSPRATDLYELGMDHRSRGEEAQALMAFQAALAAGGLGGDRRAEAERELIALNRKFGQVNVICDVPGALLTVDGRPMGRTPFPSPVAVLPGRHVFAVSGGGVQASSAVVISAGETSAVHFRR